MGAVPGAPGTAQSVLAKLDEPSIAAARGQPMGGSPQLPIAQQTTTTQSAVPMSTLKPVMDRGTQRAESQATAVQTLGDEKARIGEQQAMTAATAAYGQQQQSQAEAEQARQRAEIARMNQIAIAAQEDPQIDPGRFIRGMSTGQSVGTVILAAIEGAFRGMTGQAGQSGVLNILERRVDQDIMAQKEQIASGRIRRGNMISYFQQQGMTEESAEKAAKAMAYAQAEKLTQAEIARQGAGMARPEAAALAEQIKAAREQANDELMLTLGTPRSSSTTVRAAPSGGDGDGFSKLLAARTAYEKSGATPEQLAVFDRANGMGNMAPGGESEVARGKRLEDEKSSDQQAKAADARGSIEQHALANGLVRGADGKWTVGDGWVPPAAGEGVKGFLGMATPARDAAKAAVEAYGRFRSGGVIGPEEAVTFGEELGLNTMTRSQLASKLNAAEGTISNQLSTKQRSDASDRASLEASGFRRTGNK
jgi:hypothetical protein